MTGFRVHSACDGEKNLVHLIQIFDEKPFNREILT